MQVKQKVKRKSSDVNEIFVLYYCKIYLVETADAVTYDANIPKPPSMFE